MRNEEKTIAEELEKAAYKYSFESRPSIYGQVDVIDAFIAGAQWQKEQMLKWVREKQDGLGMLHCRDYLKAGISAAFEEIITKLTED